MDRSAMDNVFDQMGFCGIWCGSCAVGTSALMGLAAQYRQMCESHGLGLWGAEDFDYAEFLKALDSISHLPACRGCLQGGGRSDCEMRACATSRAIRACSFCSEPDSCEHKAALSQMREGGKKAGLLVAETSSDHDIPAERRAAELKSQWWWRALFETGT
jgi:hypothetical protein